MKISVAEWVKKTFDPVEIVAFNKYTNRVKLPKDLREEIERLRMQAIDGKARGAGAKVTVQALNELVKEGVISEDQPIYAYFFFSPELLSILSEKTKKPVRELESRPRVVVDG